MSIFFTFTPSCPSLPGTKEKTNQNFNINPKKNYDIYITNHNTEKPAKKLKWPDLENFSVFSEENDL